MYTFILLAALLWLPFYVLNCVRSRRAKHQRSEQSLMLVFGSGGHTTELLLMLESLNVQEYHHVHLVVA